MEGAGLTPRRHGLARLGLTKTKKEDGKGRRHVRILDLPTIIYDFIAASIHFFAAFDHS
jgi:hypothetical protein